MAHIAADGSKWSNAASARRIPRQPVKDLPKPEPARSSTAEPVTSRPAQSSEPAEDTTQVVSTHGPAQRVEINHADGHSVHSTHPDGHKHTSTHGSAEEAHSAARTLSGVEPSAVPEGNPAQAMM